jgi:YesN/AraC family two-component response regulator
VHVAEDGKQGLDLIERVRPDVVFSDVEMPER